MASNYPPGMGTGYMGTDEVTLKCPKCGHRWWAAMVGELGGWFFCNDDLAVCPKGCEDGEGYAQEGDILPSEEFDPSLRPPEAQAAVRKENMMVYSVVTSELDEEGYLPHHNDIDASVVRKAKCECGGSLDYYGFKREESYRAFQVCQSCGRFGEF